MGTFQTENIETTGYITGASITTVIVSAVTMVSNTYHGDGSNLSGIPDTFLTGVTYSNGITSFYDNSGNTLTVSGYTTGDTITIPTALNKKEIVVTPTNGDNSNTGIQLSGTPASGSYVEVKINGLSAIVGFGDSSLDCYFSSDGTINNIKNINTLNSGDYLVWNGNLAGYDLTTTDVVSIYYNIKQIN